MSGKQRRHFTAEQKLAIVKRHLVDKVPVSDLCDEHQILATQFYQWQKQLFENGASAFERKGKPPSQEAAEQRRITKLQEKLTLENIWGTEVFTQLCLLFLLPFWQSWPFSVDFCKKLQQQFFELICFFNVDVR